MTPLERAPPGPGPLSLVLGGGGARCLAHLGVARALTERGARPVAISACSTAAFIGALLAAGHAPAAVERILRESLTPALVDFDSGAGLLEQDAITTALAPHLPERFEELDTPLAVVATDLQSGERVELSSGRLLPALCASNAFPGLFSPVEIDGRVLIDGGTLDNVPVEGARRLSDAPCLAVDVGLERDERVELEGGGTLKTLVRSLTGQVTMPVAMLRKAYTISQCELIAMRLERHPPDWLLRPAFPPGVGLFSFERVDENIAIGYRAASDLLGS